MILHNYKNKYNNYKNITWKITKYWYGMFKYIHFKFWESNVLYLQYNWMIYNDTIKIVYDNTTNKTSCVAEPRKKSCLW